MTFKEIEVARHTLENILEEVWHCAALNKVQQPDVMLHQEAIKMTILMTSMMILMMTKVDHNDDSNDEKFDQDDNYKMMTIRIMKNRDHDNNSNDEKPTWNISGSSWSRGSGESGSNMKAFGVNSIQPGTFQRIMLIGLRWS